MKQEREVENQTKRKTFIHAVVHGDFAGSSGILEVAAVAAVAVGYFGVAAAVVVVVVAAAEAVGDTVVAGSDGAAILAFAAAAVAVVVAFVVLVATGQLGIAAAKLGAAGAVAGLPTMPQEVRRCWKQQLQQQPIAAATVPWRGSLSSAGTGRQVYQDH